MLERRGSGTQLRRRGSRCRAPPHPLQHLLPRQWRLRVVAVPHTLRKDKGRYGAVMLEVYGPHQTHWLNYLRTIYAANDGGRWVFDQFGEPFPFERQEQYQARRVRDRFTFDMLKEYLRHLGLSPFEEDFYLPQGAPAWLVEKTGPVVPTHEEFTLAEAPKDF